jgi:DNA-directed RNA polymerase subunit M/transcription elongation factor TFIIS
MSEEITIACPKCDSHFIVPREYIGGIVDCTECGTDFEIQALPEKEENLTKTDTGPQVKYKNTDSTKTIAISRNDLGMIPELDDVKIR